MSRILGHDWSLLDSPADGNQREPSRCDAPERLSSLWPQTTCVREPTERYRTSNRLVDQAWWAPGDIMLVTATAIRHHYGAGDSGAFPPLVEDYPVNEILDVRCRALAHYRKPAHLNAEGGWIRARLLVLRIAP